MHECPDGVSSFGCSSCEMTAIEVAKDEIFCVARLSPVNKQMQKACEAYAAAVRAEAIAEAIESDKLEWRGKHDIMVHRKNEAERMLQEQTEKFRALAEKWRKDAMTCDDDGRPELGDWRMNESAKELESILTPCPQSRHDAGEKSKP
jgi:hypothetical protein